METKPFCKDKKMAIAILEAMSLNTASPAQRAALESVIEYIQRNYYDIPESSEERQALIDQLEKEMAKTATDQERKRMIRLYCDLQPDTNFNVVVLPPGADCMLRKEGDDDK